MSWWEAGGAFLLAGGVSGIVSGIVSKWGIKWGWGDDPRTHKHPKVVHTKTVPRGGGLPIFAGLVAAASVFMPQNMQTWGIMAGAGILLLVGLADDRFEEKVSPYLRLMFNILAAVCVVGVGIGIAYISNPLGGVIRLDQWQWCFGAFGSEYCIWIVSSLFAILWLVWMQNIVGWSSGVDGQLPGFVMVAAVVMAILGQRLGGETQSAVVILGAITAGAYGGFLPWNWYPQRVMPGYGGKSLAGFLLGVLAIFSAAKVGTMLMVLGIPFMDAILVIIKRLREGRSPVWGGREHLHHMLLERGWSKKRIAIFYLIMAIILGGLALELRGPTKFYTMAAGLLFIGGVILWLQHWSISLKRPDPGNG